MIVEEFPVYHEKQSFRQVWWVMLLLFGVAVLMWWGFIQQIVFGRPWGTNPAPDWMMWLLLLLIGIGFPILFWNMCLIIEVHSDHMQLRYTPFYQRSIQWSEINSISALAYTPIRQYGGWGIRGSGRRRAYSIKGNQGVELILEDGSSVLIGSQESQELAVAIELQLSK